VENKAHSLVDRTPKGSRAAGGDFSSRKNRISFCVARGGGENGRFIRRGGGESGKNGREIKDVQPGKKKISADEGAKTALHKIEGAAKV